MAGRTARHPCLILHTGGSSDVGSRRAAPRGRLEVGRELATLVMLGAIGWLAGSRRWERLVWVAVAFVLFLVPAPRVAPVWAPMVVSLALIAVGLLAARRLHDGNPLHLARWQVAGGVSGGLFVVASFLFDAPTLLAGGVPRDYRWPLILAGMLLATGAALGALGTGPGGRVATPAG